MDLTPTPSQTAGPFFHLGLTDTRSVSCVAGAGVTGERIELTIQLLDGLGVPVPDGMIELWQADAEGSYWHHGNAAVAATFSGFGRLATSDDGSCTFETIRPGRVPGPNGKLQAPHINLSIFARGLLKQLSTRVYFAGDSDNAQDPVLERVPEIRRATLLAQPDPSHPSAWILEIRLRGENETVFFDV
jgi:protocatechuate 3,4-dioxygenase alpha subunit